MAKAVSLLLFVLAAAHVMAAAPGDDIVDYQRIVGTYQGQVLNGGGMESVETTFSLSREGALVGTYVVTNAERTFKGRLSGVMPEGPRRISMEWTDKDGEGQATMEFASDYQSFTGEWLANRGGTGPWNGRKK